MAMILINENKRVIGEDVANKSIEKIKEDSKNTNDEGGEKDGKKTKSTRRTTKSV